MAALKSNEKSAIAATIAAMMGDYPDQYAWGVRFDDPGLKVGHRFAPSRIWEDGEPTGEALDGTSVLDWDRLDSIHEHSYYIGTAYIVAGIRIGAGEDSGESVFSPCVVMAIP